MISIKKELLGILDNKEIFRYELVNSNGFEVSILNLGGIINKILVKDKNENLKNVVLSYSFFEKYIDDPSYAGAIIGPTSGRIENGRYIIDGREYILPINNGTNANHGGKIGLNSKVFDVIEVENDDLKGIELSYKWSHLHGNHHGNMEFIIRYMINEKNELHLNLYGLSDRNSYINLTNHSYFNLAGDLSINGDEQFLKINSNKICELNNNLIPTGEFIDVDKTCFDFKEYRKIKDAINQGHSQFDFTRAIDHGFVLNGENAASMYSKESGIKLDIETSQNVLVIYTGNYLDEAMPFDGVSKNSRYLGIAMEAQNYQNGINIENFDSKLTTPSKPYFEKIVYKFSNIVK